LRVVVSWLSVSQNQSRLLPANRIERARCLQDALNILEALDREVLGLAVLPGRPAASPTAPTSP
jgi:hypothetical protein